jgi:hypothetical protein
MMMNSVAARDMRVLSDAEIAMVAGGPGDGLNGLVNWGNAHWQGSDHTFLISDGRIFADYTHDGNFDAAWQPDSSCANGWAESFTGNPGSWFCGSDGGQELEEWLEAHQSWHIVAG